MVLPSFIEMEQETTTHLSRDCLSFTEMVELYDEEFLLLTSVKNQDLLKHYKNVTAITIGRLLGKLIPEMSWLLEKFPNHYDHPNSKPMSQPALLFTKAPWYYQETKNLDIQLICEQIQTDFLNMVGEQVPDKMSFLRDLELIQDQDIDGDIRIEAEARVHEAVDDFGEYIGKSFKGVGLHRPKKIVCRNIYDQNNFCRTWGSSYDAAVLHSQEVEAKPCYSNREVRVSSLL